MRESVYKFVCLSARGRQRERALVWLFSALPFSSSLTVERGVSMGQYKVQGEPLVLSHSQERVLCTAHQQEEETAAVTKNTAFRWLALHLDTCRPDFLVFRQSACEHRHSDSKTEQASPERAGGYPSRSFHLNKKEPPPKNPKTCSHHPRAERIKSRLQFLRCEIESEQRRSSTAEALCACIWNTNQLKISKTFQDKVFLSNLFSKWL